MLAEFLKIESWISMIIPITSNSLCSSSALSSGLAFLCVISTFPVHSSC